MMETPLALTGIKPGLLINALHWRYATKVFDKEQKVAEEKFELLLEALRLSPSSLNMQPWKFVVVNNKSVRRELKKYSFKQEQLTDASHLIVLCSLKSMDTAYVDKVIDGKELLDDDSRRLEGLRSYVMSFIECRPKEEQHHWMAEQVYIALGFLLSACALLHIDACPIEAFDRHKFNKVLGLDKWNIEARTAVAIGYRSKSDRHAQDKKSRLEKEDVIITI